MFSQSGNISRAKALARLFSGFRASIKLPYPIRALPAQHDRGNRMLMLRPGVEMVDLGRRRKIQHVLGSIIIVPTSSIREYSKPCQA